MREVVEQILENTYEYKKDTLDFSCAKLEIEIQQGQVYEGSFCIYSPVGKYTKGFVSATDLRMECLTTEFVGNTEEIRFCFHGDQMEAGEVTRGEFSVVSNRGEYYLPYVVSVVHTVPDSSVGPIKNLFHFANLAKSNWPEAVKMFYSPAFEKLLKSMDAQVYLCYQGLAGRDGDEQRVEEFLIAMNKKQQIEYIAAQSKLFLENPVGVIEENLEVLRNGWGFTRVEVITEGDFVFVEKPVITEDDFLGNRYSLPVYIDSSQLHAGKNPGMITLKSAYGNVTVPVEVVVTGSNRKSVQKERLRKKYILLLMELYQKFRLKQISSATWIKETIRIIDKMVALDEKDAATRLFQAQMLITCERYNEAGWILEHVGDLINGEPTPALEAYYLYLNTLIKKEEYYTKDIAEKVMRIYREHGEDWQVAWLLLFMSEEYNRSAAEKWSFLEEQFVHGCRSPLIYVEAMLLLNMNPTLLRKLGRFELQILNYGNKKGMVSLEVLEQVIYLAERAKEYSGILLKNLIDCYEKRRDSRILKEICTLLVKGNKVGKKYFRWYEKGVTEDVRIINIYEYYMLSVDLREEAEIPKQVLLYFTYQNNLDYIRSAYLYYYITRKKKVYPEVFESYLKRIELFVAEQIQKEHINKHLAYLYKVFLTEELLEKQPLAEAMSKLLFTYEISLKQPGIRNVILRQDGMEKELIFPVTNDTSYVPVYGENYCILFEDIRGNRFVKNVSFVKEKLMVPEKYVGRIRQTVSGNVLLDLYVGESRIREERPQENDLQRWLRLLEHPEISAEKKRVFVLETLQYFYSLEAKERLEEYLDGLSGDMLTSVERAEVFRYLVLCDKFDAAYRWLLQYGSRDVDEKLLLHLLENRMEQTENAFEKELLDYCHRLFAKGRYSGRTIQYLMEYYQGMVRELREIWKASRRYEVSRGAFCERILIQMLFSGTYIGEQTEIFKEYVYVGTDMRVEEAYLVKNCYDYFMNDQIIPQELLTEVGRLYSVGLAVRDICKLAYLKYYADNKEEIQATDKVVIQEFIEEMLQKGVRLNCMVELKKYSNHELYLADKTIVEYRAIGRGAIRIHYLILKGNGEDGEYFTESMVPSIGQLCSKEFVLFFGESLQYYVTEEVDGVERLTKSGTCRKEDEYRGEYGGKYSMINDIIVGKSMQDYSTFDSLLEEYYKKEFYNQNLFQLRS